ncbi:AraC family transcriptional regulator [Nocardiopsis sp. HNM0947]|uniref:AraC family transcriptional regulator n=1 Tax=Nocardiopsis coralli TaxID=2772213 RepID=A0ABR9PCC4_9ACTN|nr:AraC family transcriptional regulator [Nocardiopsis coralli]
MRSRGHLNPGDPEVRFDRFGIGADGLVRHVWVVRWSVPDGRTRPQRVLTYPAFNAVIMPGEAGLYGPDRRVSVRTLAGTSWAVGILLRPAAAPFLTDTPPERLVASHEPLVGAPLGAVLEVMERADGTDRAGLVEVLQNWLGPVAERVDERGCLVNEACRIAEERADLLRTAELADVLGLSERRLERLVKAYTGVTPKWLIECRRLQQAATTLFTRPDPDLATLADELGYADQAHFTRRYRAVLGETPAQTRRAGRVADHG